tara:strand:- start:4315 stop:5391 length:1077 start_codon:yes stop_codon:yes gene_type:complete
MSDLIFKKLIGFSDSQGEPQITLAKLTVSFDEDKEKAGALAGFYGEYKNNTSEHIYSDIIKFIEKAPAEEQLEAEQLYNLFLEFIDSGFTCPENKTCPFDVKLKSDGTWGSGEKIVVKNSLDKRLTLNISGFDDEALNGYFYLSKEQRKQIFTNDNESDLLENDINHSIGLPLDEILPELDERAEELNFDEPKAMSDLLFNRLLLRSSYLEGQPVVISGKLIINFDPDEEKVGNLAGFHGEYDIPSDNIVSEIPKLLKRDMEKSIFDAPLENKMNIGRLWILVGQAVKSKYTCPVNQICPFDINFVRSVMFNSGENITFKRSLDKDITLSLSGFPDEYLNDNFYLSREQKIKLNIDEK